MMEGAIQKSFLKEVSYWRRGWEVRASYAYEILCMRYSPQIKDWVHRSQVKGCWLGKIPTPQAGGTGPGVLVMH